MSKSFEESHDPLKVQVQDAMNAKSLCMDENNAQSVVR